MCSITTKKEKLNIIIHLVEVECYYLVANICGKNKVLFKNKLEWLATCCNIPFCGKKIYLMSTFETFALHSCQTFQH